MELTDWVDWTAFFLLFIPGFVSMKVYDLLVPGPRRDFSASFLEVAAYGTLNLGVFIAPLGLLIRGGFPENHPFAFTLVSLLALFVAPVGWPILFLRAVRSKRLRKHIADPTPRPWDFVFGKRSPHWVRVHLKDGRVIGGRYSDGSFTSSYPEPEQIYLEELWHLKDDGSFSSAVNGSEGIIVVGEEIAMVELLKYGGTADDVRGKESKQQGQTATKRIHP